LILEEAEAFIEAAIGIDNHSYRIGTWNPSSGQLRIIIFHSAGAYHDRVAQSTHAVQMGQIFSARDITGSPALGSDAPIQALPQMRDRQGASPAGKTHGQIKVEQFCAGRRHWHIRFPGSFTVDCDQGCRIIGRDQARFPMGI
jgi:hypothetical protein